MRQRDAVLVLASVVLAIGISALLAAGSLAAQRGEVRPRLFVGERAAQVRELPERAVVREVATGPASAFVPLGRGAADVSRDAAAYLLVLLGVASALVLGRDAVLACYRATAGGWRAQARVLGAGLAVVAVVASAAFLCFILLLGTAANLAAARAVPISLQPVLQGGFVALVVLSVFLALVTVVGLAAAAWRLGDAVLATRALSRWSTAVPAPLVAILAVTIVYGAAQLPYVGPAIGLTAISYALGTVVAARLAQTRGAAPGGQGS